MTRAERIATALACAVLDRELRGVLLYDLDPRLLGPLAAWLAQAGSGRGHQTVVLGADSGESDLWVRLGPPKRGFAPEPGPLADLPGRAPSLVIVPDLARTGLAGTRAAVSVLGSSVAHLERDGMSALWRPRARWLAACRREDLGRLSPHLLDRFALRVDASGLQEDELPDPSVWAARIRTHRMAGMTGEAAARVVEYFGVAGARRELALARIARCLATLDGEAAVSASQVDAAARLVGLAEPAAASPAVPALPPSQEPRTPPSEVPVEGVAPVVRDVVDAPLAEPMPTLMPPEPVPSPYMEDVLDSEREPMSLRVPWGRRSTLKALRGAPLGTVQAHQVHDIAVIATLLEAAKYQVLRCPSHYSGEPHPPHIVPLDLRRYRRAAVPGRLFALLLDHTCRGDWDWYTALAPYLRWSYAQRAIVCVVEVGAEDAPGELVARRRTGRNLLDPGVVRALDRPPGRATPLAHGLSLIADSLNRHLHRERATVEEALLVVVTDGRGNVPLSSSVTGRPPESVGREGVEDALAVAREIRAIRRVRPVLVDPRPHAGAELVADLGEALGGAIVAGRDGDDGA